MLDTLTELYRLVTVVYVHLSLTKWFYSLCNLVQKINSPPQYWKWDSEEMRFARSCLWLRELSLAELQALGYLSCPPWSRNIENYLWVAVRHCETQHISCSLIWNVHPISWKSFDFISQVLCNHLVKKRNRWLNCNGGVHPGHQTLSQYTCP